MNNERFTTQGLGRYTAEYDHKIQELRLSWSGDQTFLSHDEALQLKDFLVNVLTPRCKECGAVNIPLYYGLCEACEEAGASDREEQRYFDQSYLEPVAHPEQYFHSDRCDD